VSLGTLLLIVVVLMLVGVLPVWPHAQAWGTGPSQGIGAVLIVLLLLYLLGYLR